MLPLSFENTSTCKQDCYEGYIKGDSIFKLRHVQ